MPASTITPVPGPDEGSLQAGRAVVEAVCGACHTISGVTEGLVGPELTHIGSAAAGRKAGMSARDYIRESIEDPAGFVVDGFPAVMPPDIARIIGDDLESLLAYLESLR